ncbi:MAG: YfhO family protein, partial [Elusimicrobia bacterium]|nr:YfhO family protein [Elusimicrobiota bacterium]
DQLLDFWPWRLYFRSEVFAGRFPFWNPLIMCGVPFAANPQAAVFFPTTPLLLLLTPAAWSVAAAFLKLACAGVFTALHARRLGAGRRGAALAGTAFALCGFMVAWLGHPHTNAACLLPALFWAVGEAGVRPSPRAWAAAAVAAAVLLLGGHPPTALHALAAAAAYAVFQASRRPAAERRGFLAAAGLALLAALALAAPALLPWLEYLSWSSTGAASAELGRWATRLPPAALVHLLMPLASGSPSHGAEALQAAFGLGPSANFLERAGWLGLPALALAALAAVRRRGDAEVRFHAGLALFGLAAAFGVPPLPWLWRVLPGFSSANPTRLLLLFCFGAAVLAGLAADDAEAAPPRLTRGAAAVAAAALAAAALAVLRLRAEWTPGELGFFAGQSAAFVVEAAAALWLLAKPSARRWAPLVAALALLRAGLGVNPTAPAALLYPPTPATEALAALQGEGRVFGLGAALAPDTGMPLGLRDARGRDFAGLRRYEELVTGRAGDFDFYQGAASLPSVSSLLALSAVAATRRAAGAVPEGWAPAADGDLLVFRAPGPGRRALFVPRAETMPPEQALARARAPGFDPEEAVLLDDWFTAPAVAGAHGSARIAYEDSAEVVVSARSDGPGWVLLLDSWYPGWRAEVNGEPAAVRRADYAFRAVPVPGGESTVRFTYVPYWFWIGVFCAALSAAGLALAWRRG